MTCNRLFAEVSQSRAVFTSLTGWVMTYELMLMFSALTLRQTGASRSKWSRKHPSDDFLPAACRKRKQNCVSPRQPVSRGTNAHVYLQNYAAQTCTGWIKDILLKPCFHLMCLFFSKTNLTSVTIFRLTNQSIVHHLSEIKATVPNWCAFAFQNSQ